MKFISQFFKNWKDKSDRFDLKTSVVLLKIFEIGKIFNKTLKVSKASRASEAGVPDPADCTNRTYINAVSFQCCNI